MLYHVKEIFTTTLKLRIWPLCLHEDWFKAREKLDTTFGKVIWTLTGSFTFLFWITLSIPVDKCSQAEGPHFSYPKNMGMVCGAPFFSINKCMKTQRDVLCHSLHQRPHSALFFCSQHTIKTFLHCLQSILHLFFIYEAAQKKREHVWAYECACKHRSPTRGHNTEPAREYKWGRKYVQVRCTPVYLMKHTA